MVYVGCVFGVKILGKDKDILWYVTLVRMGRVGGDVTALCGLSMACARVSERWRSQKGQEDCLFRA
jgi:hypothetical protein